MKAESRRPVHPDYFAECAPATVPKTKNDGTVCFAGNVALSRTNDNLLLL
jgi:hypothetical protein